MTQSALGEMVGQRQLGMLEHDPKRVPIIEQLTRKRTDLLMPGLAVGHTQIQEHQELRGKLFAQCQCPGWRPFAGGVDGLHDRLDGGAQRFAEALPLALEAVLQTPGFAQKMGQTAQAVLIVPISPGAVTHEPTGKDAAEHAVEQILGAPPDGEDRCRGGGKHPQP
jgi:hypothetical protein